MTKKYFKKPSRTQQAFKNECDINQIMKRFKQVNGGDLINMMTNATGGVYGDFSEVSDYRTALDQINAANDLFDALPSKVRKEFNNDPAEFVDFAENPENLDTLIEMGLATKKQEPTKQPKNPEKTLEVTQ